MFLDTPKRSAQTKIRARNLAPASKFRSPGPPKGAHSDRKEGQKEGPFRVLRDERSPVSFFFFFNFFCIFCFLLFFTFYLLLLLLLLLTFMLMRLHLLSNCISKEEATTPPHIVGRDKQHHPKRSDGNPLPRRKERSSASQKREVRKQQIPKTGGVGRRRRRRRQHHPQGARRNGTPPKERGGQEPRRGPRFQFDVI